MNAAAAKACAAGLGGYKTLLSPLLPRACRFEPTCSDYAAQALRKHGFARGIGLAVRRLLRCHPFGGSGVDAVP
ncbi:MAG: membrane protein insertion efficiency factor YidD [bacterium]